MGTDCLIGMSFIYSNENVLELDNCNGFMHMCMHRYTTESHISFTFLVAYMVKNLPATPTENPVSSLSWEDSLEKKKATHSSILAWRIPWSEEPAGLKSMRSQRVRHD